MWYDLSIIFNEIVPSNKFSVEPQHYFEDSYDSYIPIFALIYTLELLELQLLKCSQVLLMTFFITEIIGDIVSTILMTYNV